MEKKFFIPNGSVSQKEEDNFTNQPNALFGSKDTLVEEFLNKKVSLESLIEEQIFKSNL